MKTSDYRRGKDVVWNTYFGEKCVRQMRNSRSMYWKKGNEEDKKLRKRDRDAPRVQFELQALCSQWPRNFSLGLTTAKIFRIWALKKGSLSGAWTTWARKKSFMTSMNSLALNTEQGTEGLQELLGWLKYSKWYGGGRFPSVPSSPCIFVFLCSCLS